MSRVIEEVKSEVKSRLPRRAGPYSTSLRVLSAIAIGTVLYLGRAAFIPVALAVLFSLVLATPVEALRHRGVPRAAATIVILLLLVGLIGGGINLLWSPAQSWWESAPKTLQTIDRKIRPISRAFTRLELLTNRASQLAAPAAARPRTEAAPARAPTAPPPEAPPTTTALTLLHSTGSAAASIITVIILTTFLLSGGPPMFARMSSALSTNLQMVHMIRMVEAVRREVSRYYGTIALINLGLGLATAGVTALLGMPDPLLWGAIAGVLNFLPYVGSATTLLLLSVVAFVTFDTAGRVAAVAGSYLALATLEGQVVQPLFVGRRLELNPIIVFLALWFGGWFWGIAGVVIAVPSLVVLKVVAEQSKHAQALQEFLSPNELHRYHPKQVSATLGRVRERPRGNVDPRGGIVEPRASGNPPSIPAQPVSKL